jgi:hypothetical protein
MTFRTFRFWKRLCNDNAVLGTDIVISFIFEEKSLKLRVININNGAFSVRVGLV